MGLSRARSHSNRVSFTAAAPTDAPSYILLYPENVFDLGVADLGPDVPARHRLGQLGVNANTIAGAANAAVEQIAHVEPLPDLGRRQLLPL